MACVGFFSINEDMAMANTVQPQIQIPSQVRDELLESITNKALSVLEEFAGQGRKSLELSLQLGAHISMGKKILPHGEFTAWCEKILELGATQCSVYRRLFEAKADIDKAREWAKSINRPHHSSDSPERVLVLIKEWKKATTQVSSGGESSKPSSSIYVDKLQELLQTDETAKTLRKNLIPGIAGPLERAAIAMHAHRHPFGLELLDRSQEYLAFLAKRLTDQTSGVPQLSTHPEDELIAPQQGDVTYNKSEGEVKPTSKVAASPNIGLARDILRQGKTVVANSAKPLDTRLGDRV
jgi:hypothetical protein